MFHLARHRRQIILAVQFDAAASTAYRQLKGNTGEELIIRTSDKIDLAALLAQAPGPFKLEGDLTTESK